MKNKLKRAIAMLMMAAVVSSNVQGSLVYAADTVAEKTTAPAVEESDSLHYVYVENPYLEAPGKQNIVVAWGDGTENVQNMSITVARDDGAQEEWTSMKKEENTYLFTKDFRDAAEQHTYKVLYVKFNEDGKEQIVNLSDLNAAVEFGVNQEYEGYGENVTPLDSEMQLESSIVTIDEDGQLESQNDIEEALNEVSGGKDQIQKEKSGEIVVALDPGHDNRHGGAVNQNLKLIEQELTLKIANYAKTELEQYSGVRVYMTRTTNACPYLKTTTSAECIEQRVLAAAKEGARIYVSFHLNSIDRSPSTNGAEVIFPNGNWKPQVGADGKELARKIQDQLVKLGLSDRGIYSKDTTINEKYEDGSLSDYFSVQICSKEQGIPGIIVEHAFISNTNDANKFLKTEAGLKSLGIADATGIAEFLQLSKAKWEYEEGKGWKYKENGTYVAKTWKYIDGSWYYFAENGYMRTEWLYLNNVYYYLAKDGRMRTNWQYINSNWYYFNASGVMQTGWKYVQDAWYYMDASGKMLKGWQVIGGKTYYLDGNGRMVTGFVEINGKYYYFGTDGVLVQNQWVVHKSNWYYASADGFMYTNGMYTIGNKKYVFEYNGIMRTGFVSVYNSGTKQYDYYLTDENGAVYTQKGWKYYNLNYYYINANGKACREQWVEDYYYMDSEGKMVVGTYEIDGLAYYFNNSGYCQYVLNADDAESTYTGWKLFDGNWYYYKGGKPYTGWVDGAYYIQGGKMLKDLFLEVMDRNSKATCYNYLGYNGKKVQNGWRQITVDNNMKEWIYAEADGKIAENGWKLIGGKWYYFQDCMMVKGIVEINGKTEVFNESGVWIEQKQRGWVNNCGLWYYFKSDGTMVKNVNTYTINGTVFYFWWNGALRCNEVVTDPSTKKMYYLNERGYSQLFTGWKAVNNTWYYADKNGKTVNGLQNIDGVSYFFREGVMQTGYIEVDESGNTYFFGASGARQNVWNGWASDGKNWYYFVGGSPVKNRFYTINGAVYVFDSMGKMQTGTYKEFLFAEGGQLVKNAWAKVNGIWYYGDATGRYVCGQRIIGTGSYWFDELGRMI